MTGQLFEVKITATGEVRDADGNLISSGPVEFEPQIMSEEQLAALAKGAEQ